MSHRLTEGFRAGKIAVASKTNKLRRCEKNLHRRSPRHRGIFPTRPPRFFRLVRACSIGMTFSLRNQRGPFRPVRISPVLATRSSSQIQNRRRKVSLSSSSSSVSGLRRINGTSLTDVFLPY